MHYYFFGFFLVSNCLRRANFDTEPAPNALIPVVVEPSAKTLPDRHRRFYLRGLIGKRLRQGRRHVRSGKRICEHARKKLSKELRNHSSYHVFLPSGLQAAGLGHDVDRKQEHTGQGKSGRPDQIKARRLPNFETAESRAHQRHKYHLNHENLYPKEQEI